MKPKTVLPFPAFWLCVLALALFASLLRAAGPATQAATPPIPIRFTLDAPGYVTLVVEDAHGNRVRNLVSNTHFEKGINTVYWDGTDDLARNPDAANHGVYLIPTHFVGPGTYHVRGLVHDAIDLHYEFSVYNPGHPAWETPDTKGGWLTNHTPPSSALFVPADRAPGGQPLVYIGSYVSEGGAGLAWVDLKGKKQGGRGWIGGAWTAAPFLARDEGQAFDPAVFAYVAAPTGDAFVQPGKPVTAILRITGLTGHGDKAILNYSFHPSRTIEARPGVKINWAREMSGLAIRNGLLVVSLPFENQLLFIDAKLDPKTGHPLGTAIVDHPMGLAFAPNGDLLVLSGKQLLRYRMPNAPGTFNPQQLPKPETLVSQGLEAPSGITVDPAGNIYVSDDGNTNQVHVYTGAGRLVRNIGHPGPSKAGPYDSLHMNTPAGLAVDSNHHLWVTEADFQPKRVSEWSLEGQLIQDFYGPAEYGGGGSLDPQDKTEFYYHGMEFKLDWQTGVNNITNILYRPGADSLPIPNVGYPSTVLYSNGHRYFINSYLGQATNGVSVGMLYLDKGGILTPVAAMGRANDWPLLNSNEFKPILPPGSDLSNHSPDKSILFTWSDTNQNGKVDPEEVHFAKSSSGAITIQAENSVPGVRSRGPIFLNALVNGKVMRYIPTGVTPSGIPSYDLNQGDAIADGAQPTASDGGGQVLESPTDVVLTTAPLPYPREGLGGEDTQHHTWSYPSLWPGLHPSHSAPIPDRPGELNGTTHLLGAFVSPPNSAVKPLWAINGNAGDIYVFTADGLFVTQLFQDARTGKTWNMPNAQRNMLLNDVSLSNENFYPSITQTSDGNIYVLDGSRTSIVRVDGLNTLRPLPVFNVTVTGGDINKAQSYLLQSEITRQSQSGSQSIHVAVHSGPPPTLSDLVKAENGTQGVGTDWATVDHRIIQQGWSKKPDNVEASISIAGNRLFAVYRTNEPKLLINAGSLPNAPFKTGGALDLMIGASPSANPRRSGPVAGDVRLLVYLVNGKPHATLYRAVVPGTANPVPFSSPARTITLDQVEDVTSQLQFAASNGNYAFSMPLATLGLKPTAGQRIKADIGILRGNGTQTIQRAYWSNKATGITSDVPSEAELTPQLWGEWIFNFVP